MQKKPIWERQAGETVKAYNAFTYFRSLPTGQRSVFKAYIIYRQAEIEPQTTDEEIRRKHASKPPKHWRDWSHKYNWFERVKAFDDENERIYLVKQREEILDAKRRHVQAAQIAQQAALTIISRARLNEIGDEDAQGKIGAATNLLALGIKTEREELGQPSEIVETHNTNEHTATLIHQLESADLDAKIAEQLEKYFTDAATDDEKDD